MEGPTSAVRLYNYSINGTYVSSFPLIYPLRHGFLALTLLSTGQQPEARGGSPHRIERRR